jgi:predicted amidohydrolase
MKNPSLRIAAIQMKSSDDSSRNLRLALDLLHDAMTKDVDMIAFPEYFLYFSSQAKSWAKVAQSEYQMWEETLCEWAAEFGIWIIAPVTPPSKTRGKVENLTLLINPNGEIKKRYPKSNLFHYEGTTEEAFTQFVKKPLQVAKTTWGNLGMATCFDLRFPEIFRKYIIQNAAYFTLPSAFLDSTGKAHWDTLTRARAIENQCFLIAPALWGEPVPGVKHHGHTRIIDPWGRILAERPAGDGVVFADLDMKMESELRKSFPILPKK